MHGIDIALLVQDALKISGCDPALIGELDNHSTIELNLHDLPSIHISMLDGEVWFWSRLVEYNVAALAQCAAAILPALMEGRSYVRGGQLQLAVADEMLELKAMVHPDYLADAERFSDALSGYFNALEQFSGSLLR